MTRLWYLVYTKPRQELLAKENLLRQEYTIFLPMTWVRKRRLMQYHLAHEPLFPRYLFIKLSAERDNWAPIRSTKGVVQLVRFGMSFAKVPEALILYLENALLQQQPPSVTPEFKKGDRVKVTAGVFAGYEAIFEVKTSHKRVAVLLDILGQYTRIYVSSGILEGNKT